MGNPSLLEDRADVLSYERQLKINKKLVYSAYAMFRNIDIEPDYQLLKTAEENLTGCLLVLAEFTRIMYRGMEKQ